MSSPDRPHDQHDEEPHRAPQRAAQGAPAVGVVMPILNEERHLEEAVAAVLGQRYAGSVTVVLALGPSTDRTDEIAADLVRREPRVRTVRNPSGRTPEALNAALAALPDEVEVVVRVDGHGILEPDYVRTACELLEQTGAANVGGVMHAEGVTTFERAVAAAMTSRLGVGNAAFHTGGASGPADTVYLGVFRREWLRRMGGYDERFTRAQDWELNHRIREAGGLVWFSPELRVTYRPRPTLATLARQYRDYGRWRRVVAREHRGTINLRYLAPPTALVLVAGGAVAGFLWAPAWVLPAGYLSITTLGGLTMKGRLDWRERLLETVVLPTMHLSWGWGFLSSPRDLMPELDHEHGVPHDGAGSPATPGSLDSPATPGSLDSPATPGSLDSPATPGSVA